jgi:hypothetical protein
MERTYIDGSNSMEEIKRIGTTYNEQGETIDVFECTFCHSRFKDINLAQLCFDSHKKEARDESVYFDVKGDEENETQTR